MTKPTTIETVLKLVYNRGRNDEAVKIDREELSVQEALATIEQLVLERVIHPLVPEVGYGSTEEIREQNLRLAKAFNKRVVRQRQALKQLLQKGENDE